MLSAEDLMHKAQALRQQAALLASSRENVVESLQKDLENARAQLRQQSISSQKKHTELERENQSFKAALETLRKRENLASMSAKQWEACAEQRREANTILQNELEKERVHYEGLQQNHNNSLKELQELRFQHDELASTSKATIGLLTLRAERAESKVQELTNRLASTSEDMRQLGDQIPKTMHDMQTLERQCLSLTQQLKEVSAEFESEKSERNRLGEQLDFAKKYVQELEEECKKQEESMQELLSHLGNDTPARHKIQYVMKLRQENEILRQQLRQAEGGASGPLSSRKAAPLRPLADNSNLPSMESPRQRPMSATKKGPSAGQEEERRTVSTPKLTQPRSPRLLTSKRAPR